MFNALLSTLFALVLWIPMLGLRQAPTTAVSEKRLPAPRPALPRTWEQVRLFPNAFESWFNDHFGLRDVLIRTHARVLIFALKTSPSPKAILGRDGFIFLRGRPDDDGNPIADFRGTKPLSMYELERWRWQIEDESEWMRSHGISFLFAVAPGKERMASYALPPGFGNIGKPGALDQFTAHLAPRATYRFLDLTEAVRTARDAAHGFRKTDTHWNDDGAWAAINAMIDSLRAEFPAMPKTEDLDLVRTHAWYSEGDMGNVLGLPGETGEWLDWIRPRVPHAQATLLRPHHLADVLTDTGNQALPAAVLFHDSFGHYLKPFFGEYFRQLRYCWSNAGLDLRAVAAHHPQIVIHLMGERRIRMGQRYSTTVQQHGNRARFERSKIILGKWTPSSGPPPITLVSDTIAGMEPDGCALSSRAMQPAAWECRAIPETTNMLPVVKFKLYSRRNNELALAWQTTAPEYCDDFVPLLIKAPVPAGESEVYLPLLDPDAVGPLCFQFSRQTGNIILRSLEIRAVPR